MAAKKKFGAKADFIRSMPSAPAKEVVEAGKKRGLKISINHVYAIRASAGAGAKKGKPGPEPGATARRVGRPPRASGGDAAEKQLRAAIAAIGLTAARRILDEVEATFAGQ